MNLYLEFCYFDYDFDWSHSFFDAYFSVRVEHDHNSWSQIKYTYYIYISCVRNVICCIWWNHCSSPATRGTSDEWWWATKLDSQVSYVLAIVDSPSSIIYSSFEYIRWWCLFDGRQSIQNAHNDIIFSVSIRECVDHRGEKKSTRLIRCINCIYMIVYMILIPRKSLLMDLFTVLHTHTHRRWWFVLVLIVVFLGLGFASRIILELWVN